MVGFPKSGHIYILGDLLFRLGNALPQELYLNALADIAEGLDYMHKQGVVHGTLNQLMF